MDRWARAVPSDHSAAYRRAAAVAALDERRRTVAALRARGALVVDALPANSPAPSPTPTSTSKPPAACRHSSKALRFRSVTWPGGDISGKGLTWPPQSMTRKPEREVGKVLWSIGDVYVAEAPQKPARRVTAAPLRHESG